MPLMKMEMSPGLTNLPSMNPLSADLLSLALDWEKQAAAFSKLANVPVGSKPEDVPPDRRGLIYSAGSYRTCADQLRKLIKSTDQNL